MSYKGLKAHEPKNRPRWELLKSIQWLLRHFTPRKSQLVKSELLGVLKNMTIIHHLYVVSYFLFGKSSVSSSNVNILDVSVLQRTSWSQIWFLVNDITVLKKLLDLQLNQWPPYVFWYFTTQSMWSERLSCYFNWKQRNICSTHTHKHTVCVFSFESLSFNRAEL